MRLTAQKRELELATQRVREMSIERDRLRSELAEERALGAARARNEASRNEEHAQALAQVNRRVQELERKLGDQRELEARLDELEAQALEVVTLRAQNSELEARLAALATTPKIETPEVVAKGAERVPAGDARDDLRKIRGIGPKFAETLRAHGVASYADIAAWTGADIERFARLLRLKPERITREDWVGAARSLLGIPETS